MLRSRFEQKGNREMPEFAAVREARARVEAGRRRIERQRALAGGLHTAGLSASMAHELLHSLERCQELLEDGLSRSERRARARIERAQCAAAKAGVEPSIISWL
ncbi:hypothetical protein B1812_18035 [Methylocystis bryophila]|uniref:Uncharacterized protein n=1 Tax=Methylocystis bryophila TaxID=655015 RepID=A0A1W6MYR4_9HYPH|nr:hypothetical protein B1812_18035 [Methylocystis bryophila]